MSGDWLSSAASISTIVGLVIIILQQIKQSRDLEADIRAYLHLDIKKSKFAGGKEMVLLTIFNSGEVAAEEVLIVPEVETKWFALNGDTPPDFTQDGTKLRILPGEELVFLLGPLKELPTYMKPGIKVQVQYRRVPGRNRRAKESQHLTLEPRRYLLDRKIH